MFRIEMLPAAHGDALWIEYGDGQTVHRVLIDGGTPPVYKALKSRMEQLPVAERRFELLVVTHIDADHIGGALALLEKNELGAVYGDIWFNGYGHLLEEEIEAFGAVQGERLTTALLDQGLPWNKAFNHKAVRVADDGAPVVHSLPGGMKLTLLSPTRGKLAALEPKWVKECRKAGLDPQTEVVPEAPPGVEPMGAIDVDALAATPFTEDTAEANGSSIAMLAEYGGKRVLLGADAHPRVLVEAIEKLVGSNAKLDLDACKLPHHGSNGNVSPDLIRKLSCPLYLVSTSGAQFHHPDRAAIARVIHLGGGGAELAFNYRSQYNEVWDDPDLRDEHGYLSRYPHPGEQGLIVALD
jgi:beta-lactamase superfamily II metal-dependent hydrolase